ncbi:DUF1702 family protein [Paenibacillus kobensis]|uniref:DUF1702 family protein n=1 Tax=Paenibacillus kobensis TaxID=59841 RepID=UPI000FD92219|nr:DUF1702 family protein [Paenibacillus kobensis]
MINGMQLWLGVAVIIMLGIPLLYLRMFHVSVPRILKRFQVSKSTLFNMRFPIILSAFLNGNNYVILPIIKFDRIRSFLGEFDPYYRGFAYEGAGMGFAARASLWLNKGKRFEYYIQNLDANYLYQYYVGLGWWLHTRYRYRYDGYVKWLKTLDPRYASIVFDGVGFKSALFEYPVNPLSYQKFDHFPLAYRRVCLQGFGRGLWFAKQFQINETVSAIEQMPAACQQDVYSGLGLAIAYSFFDQLPVAEKALQHIPRSGLAAFHQGLAFGLEARKLQNERYWMEQLASFQHDISDGARWYVERVHEAKKMIENISNDKIPYYIKWMDEARVLLDNKGYWKKGGV